MTNRSNDELRDHPALAHALQRIQKLNLDSKDQFELYFERSTQTKVDSRDQAVDSLSRAEDVGLAIRLVKDQRMGFSFTTSLEKAAISKAVEAAAEVAAFMPEDPFAKLFSFSTSVYPSVDIYDERSIKTPAAQKVALAKQLEAACRKADTRVTGVRAASLSETISEMVMVDTSGEIIHHRATLYSASVTCKAESNGDHQIGGDYGFSTDLDRLDVNAVGKQAAFYATELLGAGSAPTLKCPAVLRNSVVSELIEFLSESFSAEQIDKGRSILAGKQGEAVCSEHITLTDDGLLAGGYATAPFDAEGVPSKKNVLIDKGFFNRPLYDGYYSRKFKTVPSGTSSRGIKSPPSIGFTNLFMEPGRKTLLQLCEGISKGILIVDLMGIHTANPVTGDFSLGASGILIENGKLTKPVRGFAVAGNVLDLFRKMTDVGNDLKFFGSIGAPSVRVAELSVGGT